MQDLLRSTANFSVYGVTVASNFDLSRLLPAAAEEETADLAFLCVDELPSELSIGPGKVVFDRQPIRMSRHAEWDVLAFEDSTVHYVSSNQIVCHVKRLEHEFLVPIQLLGMVMAVWLEARGNVVLHASAVATSMGAFLFLAGGKAGKTSLAAAFGSLGDSIVTEDLAALSMSERIFVQPGYPLMRMWPESASHFLGSSEGFAIYHPAFEKLWVPMRRLGRFQSAPVEVSRLFLPERKPNGPIEIRALPHVEAVKSLLAGSFLADIAEPASDVAGRFEKIVDIVNTVPVYSLVYPEGFEHLPEVREALLADLSG